jgi:hypothetical protein
MAEEEIAQQQQVSQQKILILPPMKGLNLYDNPFTMDMSFAVELVNYMPPTTVMMVRPGIQKLAEMYGAVRGIYSYATGATKNYGKHWYDQTISEGERQLLILKFAQNSGDSVMYSFNPLGNQYESIATIKDHNYTKDYTNFKHSMFFCSGNQNSPMYVWSSRVGFKPMAWIASDRSTELSDLENITFYNGYLFANSYNTFDIYYMKETEADPTQQTGWDKFWSFFSPKYAGQLSLDGIATKGGSIMKMFHLSRNGLNGVESYLGVCTNMGEVVLFQGIPDDEDNPLHPVGRFEIPVPLNKNCFCKMEGDMVVATKNGLVSLMRVVFGQSNSVTQSLETRIKNLFDDYMFKMNEFKEWIGLYYNFKNRLLILNVPTQMPIPLNKIARGYTFTNEQRIMLPKFVEDHPTDVISQLCFFIRKYLYPSWIDYKIFLQFNDSTLENADGIYITFETDLVAPETSFSTITRVSFYVICEGVRTDFFNNGDEKNGKRIQFSCEDFINPDIDVKFVDSFPFQWNQDFKKTYENLAYYEFSFPQQSDKTYTVTDMIVKTNLFATSTSVDALNDTIKDTELLGSKLQATGNLNSFKYIKDFPTNYTFNSYMKNLYDNCDGRITVDGDPNAVYEYFSSRSVPKDVPLYVKKVLLCISRYSSTFHSLLPSIGSKTNVEFVTTYVVKNLDTEDTKEYICTINLSFSVSAINPLQVLMTHKETFSLPGIGINYINWVINIVFREDADPVVRWMDFIKEHSSFYSVPFEQVEIVDLSKDQWIVSDVHVLFNQENETWADFFCGDSEFKVFLWKDKVISEPGDMTLFNTKMYGWMFAPFEVLPYQPPSLPPPPPPTLGVNEEFVQLTSAKSKNAEVFKNKPPILISRALMGLTVSFPINTVQNTNFDLSLVPLFTGVNILAPFRSSQYVMDSYYGTWSQWKDVNMIDGIDHANEFYFIIPEDYEPSVGGFIYNKSMLCKFNPEANGDFEDMFHPENTKAIKVNYKTAAGNFGDNRIKEISKIKIYATASTFWGELANNLTVTMHSDFFENPFQKYQHSTSRPDIRKVLGLSEDFDLRNLTYSQKKKYNQIYLEMSSYIKNIEMGLTCKTANRIALELDMEIKEHNIIIYGYEIYFKALNKL